jgi:hypothetical protein
LRDQSLNISRLINGILASTYARGFGKHGPRCTEQQIPPWLFIAVHFFLTSVFHNLVFESVAYKRRLLKSDIGAGFVSKLRKSYRFGLAIYAVATLVAMWSAIAELVLATALWLLWIPVHLRKKRVEENGCSH